MYNQGRPWYNHYWVRIWQERRTPLIDSPMYGSTHRQIIILRLVHQDIPFSHFLWDSDDLGYHDNHPGIIYQVSEARALIIVVKLFRLSLELADSAPRSGFSLIYLHLIYVIIFRRLFWPCLASNM